MKIVTDLEYIKEKALEREEENWEFRAFLKQLDMAPKEIDAIVHKINDKATSQIDCTQCANCCKQIRPVLDEDDVSNFALGLGNEVSEFRERYLSQDADNSKQYIFKELSCPFLAKNKCSNYDCRPKDCRSYPHLHKKDFISRLWGVIENYGVCPIVFNVYEQLKIELWNNDFINNDDFDFEWE
jgi:Fe-S-cluster containining protein